MAATACSMLPWYWTRRHDTRKPIVTTNKVFSEWLEAFPRAACTVTPHVLGSVPPVQVP
jgi:hypothetical protein